jgi:hypothetical protein
MKNQLTNIALEGTCSGDVVGGLLLWAGENLQALLFLKGGETRGHKRSELPLCLVNTKRALTTTFNL